MKSRPPRQLAATLAVICLGLTLSCAAISPQEQEVLVRIPAKRIGDYGAKHWPGTFTELGKFADAACISGNTSDLKTAFTYIAQQAMKEIEDPLLRSDLQDIIALIGLRLDPAFKIIELTVPQQNLLHSALCGFAYGVRYRLGPY